MAPGEGPRPSEGDEGLRRVGAPGLQMQLSEELNQGDGRGRMGR